MKSLVISLGGIKAARIADILAYYSRRLESHITVEVFDIYGKEIPDASIQVVKDYDAPPEPGTDSERTVAYLLKVTKEGYQPVKKTIWIKNEQVTTARVILARERTHYLITAVFLSLLAPFIWAAMKYIWGFVTAAPADYLTYAIAVFLFQLAGALIGLRVLGKRLEPIINDQYYSGIIGILTGEVLAVLISTYVLTPLFGAIWIISGFLTGYAIGPGDIAIIITLIVLLSLAGLIFDQRFQHRIDRSRFSASLFVAFGAMVGGALSNYATGWLGNLAASFTTAGERPDVSLFFPLIIFVSTLLWCYLIVAFLKKRELIKDSNTLSEAVYSILGVVLIAGILPVITGRGSILFPFLIGSLAGAIAGLLLYFLIFGHSLEVSEVSSIKEGSGLMKKYRLSTVSICVETVRSRLENLKFVSPDHILFIDEPERDPVSFFNTNLKEMIQKKITNLYRKNLEDCNRLFSSFVLVIDLRNNNLCEMLPSVLSFLGEEYSLPIYCIVIAKQGKLNRNWLKKVVDRSDAVIPVDYALFDEVMFMDRFLYQEDDTLVFEDVYEEGCVVELVKRFAPFLEIGERNSPSGLDVSHVHRVLSKKRIPLSICDDFPDVIPPFSQNVATFGHFQVNKKKCSGINLQLAMGEYLAFALKNPLWKIERARSGTRALVIVRGKREHIVTGLVRRWIERVYDGLVIMTGDLLTDTDDALEITILISNIFDELVEDPDIPGRCSDVIPEQEPAKEPGPFTKLWLRLTRKSIPGSEEAEERFRCGSPEAYVAIAKKYYRRSPLVRYRAVSIARDHPGVSEWEQAKLLCEWVRDNINYVCDPYGSEYIQIPDETLTNMGGDCDDQAVLLASLLMNVGFRCALVFCECHVYVATYLPKAPDTVRTYPPGEWPDQTPARDWVGFDPTCTNCHFGELPKSDLNIESVYIIA
ncbi:MAG: hypothetical protein KA091_02355 [Methanoregulaceae archaeon]|jgi:hypothetical protein|nr:hypothetical protein [Methanoregulaceae archaeon]